MKKGLCFLATIVILTTLMAGTVVYFVIHADNSKELQDRDERQRRNMHRGLRKNIADMEELRASPKWEKFNEREKGDRDGIRLGFVESLRQLEQEYPHLKAVPTQP